jgi:2'-5' RNA ligase
VGRRVIRSVSPLPYIQGMNFTDDSYIVLDVPPSEWTECVLSVRRQLDAWRAVLPVEVTLTGSAGVGAFHGEQDQDVAFRVIDALASEAAPIRTQLLSIKRFPNSGVFYFEPVDPRPFIDLQSRIIATGLKFKPSALPYIPHCTIANLKNNLSDEAVREIYRIPPPEEVLTLEVVSFYAVNQSGCRLLHRTKLCGTQYL